jgi:hypothetical protein
MPAPQSPAKRLFPNPFYVLLLLASTLFVATSLAYLVAPMARERAERAAMPGAGAPSPAADWLDRRGPLALGVEFAVMLAAGLLAMATDRWFPEKPARPKAQPDRPVPPTSGGSAHGSQGRGA